MNLLKNFNISQLQSYLFNDTKFFYLQEVDSTNTYAKNLISTGAPEGTVVLSDSQTNGRGQQNNIWYSPAGKNIYCSIILKPKKSDKELPLLTEITAKAIAAALHSMYPLDYSIKYPNDILIHGKKICGILTEMEYSKNNLHIVLGFGINCNMVQNDFPEPLKHISTSLKIEMDCEINTAKVLKSVLQFFEKYYNNFNTGSL